MSRALHDWKELSAPEKESILIPLLESGLTSSEIAMRFSNATRNAVVGFVIRRNPHLTFQSGRTGGRYRPKPMMVKTERKPQALAKTKLGAKAAVPPFVPQIGNKYGDDGGVFCPSSAPKDARMISLDDLKAGLCRWPLYTNGPRLFCGADAKKSKSYCEHHDKIAHPRNKSFNTFGGKL